MSKKPPKRCVAAKDFTSDDPDDLHFKVGEMVIATDYGDEDEWWYGEIEGSNGERVGCFIQDYVCKMEDHISTTVVTEPDLDLTLSKLHISQDDDTSTDHVSKRNTENDTTAAHTDTEVVNNADNSITDADTEVVKNADDLITDAEDSEGSEWSSVDEDGDDQPKEEVWVTVEDDEDSDVEDTEKPSSTSTKTENVTEENILSMNNDGIPCHLLVCTNAISKRCCPGDAHTNRIYSEMMTIIDLACRDAMEWYPGFHWRHRLFPKESHSFQPSEENKHRFKHIPARAVTDEELLCENTHSQKYLNKFRQRTLKAEKANKHFELPSAGYDKNTETASRAGVGSLIDAAMAVAEGKASSTFVLCRPPTHHAVGNEQRCRGESPKLLPYGFCHMNAISTAIAVVRQKMASQWGERARMVILDVDVHPGNGNEDTWWNDASVLHINLNQSLIWPGPKHGDPKHVGGKHAIGANLNFPIPAKQGNAAYTYTILKHVIPIIQGFKPKMIFVACGFDAIRGDAYASMNLTPQWFGWLAAELLHRNLAPLVFNLEGGYNPANSGAAAIKVFQALSLDTRTPDFRKMHVSNSCLGSTATYSCGGIDIRAPRPSIIAHIDECRKTQLDTIASQSKQ